MISGIQKPSRSAATAALLLFCQCIAGCGGPSEAPAGYTLSGETMGTTYSVQVSDPEPAIPQGEAAALIEAILQRIDESMSTWRDDSELARFNALRSLEPIRVGQELFEVLTLAQQVSAETGGAFDVTIKPLIDAYGFGRKPHNERPSDDVITQARECIGFQHLELDPAARTLRKRLPALEVDVSAIAPGFAADIIYRELRSRGLRNLLVDVGGEFIGTGESRRGGAWRVAIEKPLTAEHEIETVVPLEGLALATSGDYRNFYMDGETRISHTIDPRTGLTIGHSLASASVVHASAALADAYATALMVLGPEQGREFALRHNLAAFFIMRAPEAEAFSTLGTPMFERYTESSVPRRDTP